MSSPKDSVLLTDPQSRFKTVDLRPCEDDAVLSWKAIGLLLYLTSRPPHWSFNFTDIENRHSDGRESVRSGLKELQDAGYLRIERERVRHGRFARWIWRASAKRMSAEDWKRWRTTVPPKDGFSEVGETESGEPVGIAVRRSTIEKTTLGPSLFGDEPTEKVESPFPAPSKLKLNGNGRVYPDAFERAWEVYPKRAGGNPKQAAYSQFRARVRAGDAPETLMRAAERYAEWCRLAGREGTEFVSQAATFWGPSERFRDFLAELPAVPQHRGAGTLEPSSFADEELRRFEGLKRGVHGA